MAQSAFAKKQLEKHGWKEGDGLGKKRDGISVPIKANIKKDRTGVGHDPGSDFKDHWWLRVFNDAAKSITKSTEDGDSDEEEKEAPPTKDYTGFVKAKCLKEEIASRQKIYKGFVKRSLLSNGEEKQDSDCSDSDDDTDSNQWSSEIPTLDDIHKFCGGATGSRAGTLGIKMSGKISRAAEQERLFNEKMTKKQTEEIQSHEKTENYTESIEPTKKSKRKKNKLCQENGDVIAMDTNTRLSEGLIQNDPLTIRISHDDERQSNGSASECLDADSRIEEGNTTDISENKSKKKKKRKREDDDVSAMSEIQPEIKKKKKKSKKKDQDDDNICASENSVRVSTSQDIDEEAHVASNVQVLDKENKNTEHSIEIDEECKQKKKEKKKKKRQSVKDDDNDSVSSVVEILEDAVEEESTKKRKRKEKSKDVEVNEVLSEKEIGCDEYVLKSSKKKKKKKNKD